MSLRVAIVVCSSLPMISWWTFWAMCTACNCRFHLWCNKAFSASSHNTKDRAMWHVGINTSPISPVLDTRVMVSCSGAACCNPWRCRFHVPISHFSRNVLACFNSLWGSGVWEVGGMQWNKCMRLNRHECQFVVGLWSYGNRAAGQAIWRSLVSSCSTERPWWIYTSKLTTVVHKYCTVCFPSANCVLSNTKNATVHFVVRLSASIGNGSQHTSLFSDKLFQEHVAQAGSMDIRMSEQHTPVMFIVVACVPDPLQSTLLAKHWVFKTLKTSACKVRCWLEHLEKLYSPDKNTLSRKLRVFCFNSLTQFRSHTYISTTTDDSLKNCVVLSQKAWWNNLGEWRSVAIFF